MILIAIIAFGVGAGYLSIWSSVVFNKSLEERAASLLIVVLVDVTMLIFFMLYGSGSVLTLFLIAKYLFLSIVNFDKTLRQ